MTALLASTRLKKRGDDRALVEGAGPEMLENRSAQLLRPYELAYALR